LPPLTKQQEFFATKNKRGCNDDISACRRILQNAATADKLFLSTPVEALLLETLNSTSNHIRIMNSAIIICPANVRVKSFRAWKLSDLDEVMNRWLKTNTLVIGSVLSVTVTPGSGKYCGTIVYTPKLATAPASGSNE
jgi:hypothetical protein